MTQHLHLLKRLVAGPIAALICCALLTANTLADTVTLKDGTVIDGTIVNQDSETVTIKMTHSGGVITQTKQIAKSDIAEIKVLTDEERAAQAEENEWGALQTLRVDPVQSHRLDIYDRVIARFQAFQARYPNSAHRQEVADMMIPWQDERKQVAEGLIKHNGEWMSATELQQQASDAEAQQMIDDARTMFSSGKYIPALQKLNKLSAMRIDPDLKTQAQDLVTQIYRVWYPYLDRRSIQLQSELAKARASLETARREHAEAQKSVKIDSGGFKSTGGSTIRMGQDTTKAQATKRLADAKARLDSTQTAVTKLEEEQRIVSAYHTHARNNADRLNIRDTIAKVEEAKNPTSNNNASSAQTAIDKNRRRLASESSGGVLADMTRWGEDNWPWALALLAGLLYLLYKYLIK